MNRKAAEWSPYAAENRVQLKLFNSLTRKKEVFRPLNDNLIKWYGCGPTVYDAAHLGHARCYMCFDILRRVLENYFGYNVFYVMNITDIDDKIIRRARREYLSKTITDDVQPGFDKESQMDYLDDKYKESVPIDNEIFREFASSWEEKFHEDMRKLNIKEPNALTRVSDFIEEIIEFTQTIIDNGFAYVSKSGSVYFDVTKFDDDKNHFYAKLVPEAYGNIDSLNEGEGVLADNTDKRKLVDFALWKASKSGEPAWKSPWGMGRPGWHIECSVMASKLCGDRIDIHTGGVDLKFPHHDNELAQSESVEWIKYFIHSGHLTISGCKMSKSLKNFITIEDALKSHTARQIRFTFLLHNWLNTLDYSIETLDSAVQYEKFLNEFFLNVKDALRQETCLIKLHKLWTKKDMDLNTSFLMKKNDIHIALCDSIDTRTVMSHIKDIVHISNTYMSTPDQNLVLLRDVATYISNLLDIFGINDYNQSIGFVQQNEQSVNVEEIAYPFVKALCDFRTTVRSTARDVKNVDILKECDRLRDVVLPALGVRIEDKEDRTIMKFIHKNDIKEENIQEIKVTDKAKKITKDNVEVLSPETLFVSLTDQYSKFDDMATFNISEALYNEGYTLGHTIGEGTYSKVKIACRVKKSNSETLACKIIDKSQNSMQFRKNFLPRELAISRKLNHHNIVKVFEIVELLERVYIFMEYCEYGDLLDHLKKVGALSESQSRLYFRQMLSAITYLHRLDIAHRDLKCENILLASKDIVKVADFGFSRLCKDKNGVPQLSETYCGSTSYASPEVIQGIRYNPKAYDMWSLGCILYAMISKKQPFDDSNLKNLLNGQKKRNFMHTSSFQKCSLLLKRLIYYLLEPNPEKRITIRYASHAEWIKVRD